ncbi:hypothetical protein JCM8208_001165 [Rhodotorula glutinis]
MFTSQRREPPRRFGWSSFRPAGRNPFLPLARHFSRAPTIDASPQGFARVYSDRPRGDRIQYTAYPVISILNEPLAECSWQSGGYASSNGGALQAFAAEDLVMSNILSALPSILSSLLHPDLAGVLEVSIHQHPTLKLPKTTHHGQPHHVQESTSVFPDHALVLTRRHISTSHKPSPSFLYLVIVEEKQAGYVTPSDWQPSSNKRWILAKNTSTHLNQLIGICLLAMKAMHDLGVLDVKKAKGLPDVKRDARVERMMVEHKRERDFHVRRSTFSSLFAH